MVIYEVTSVIRLDLIEAYERYMIEHHIPELIATGCFHSAEFTRTTPPGRYCIFYKAPDQAALDRYLSEHAARLRADVAAHFPEGMEFSRDIWTVIREF